MLKRCTAVLEIKLARTLNCSHWQVIITPGECEHWTACMDAPLTPAKGWRWDMEEKV